MQTQQKIWNNIAPEWEKFKQIPSKLSEDFLKNCSGKILDLGSGSGRHLKKMKDGKMYLVDFSEKMIKLAEKKAKKLKIPAEFFVADLKSLPFENNFFDFSICISAIHCLKPKEHQKAIKELYRVMKKNSKSLIGVWNFNSKRFNQKKGKEKLIDWRKKGKRYYYLFDEKEIHDLFKKAKFKILSTHNTEMMINFIVEK
ncbi:MAG: class I SAM-dependent methyltransferase [Candidatus Pacearchaeota archaeon]|jgi:ubiquinone/menaquinone biosynthesis C-methylase UbiE